MECTLPSVVLIMNYTIHEAIVGGAYKGERPSDKPYRNRNFTTKFYKFINVLTYVYAANKIKFDCLQYIRSYRVWTSIEESRLHVSSSLNRERKARAGS